MNTIDLNAKYIITPFAELKLYNQAYDILKKMTKGNEFRILSIEPDEFDNIKSVVLKVCNSPGITTIRLSQREIDAFISLAPNQLIDFDVASTYVCPVKPLEIKETTMTIQTIEAGKTYKLVQEVPENLEYGFKALSFVLGAGPFTVESVTSDHPSRLVFTARRHDTGTVEKTVVYNNEYPLFEEVVEQDPTDLLTKAVAIETPFKRVCGWVTDQWVEDGVELLNVVHAGDFSVVPRSAVVNVLN